MASKPTFILVPGAFHLSQYYSKIAPLLAEQGYNSVPVTLASTSSNPTTSLADDIAAVRAAILSQITQGIDVVVVAHSYGGIPGSSAIKGLAKPSASNTTSATGKPGYGHVIGLILLASGFNAAGLSFLDGLGGTPPPLWRADKSSGFAMLVGDARQAFYNDLPIAEAEEWEGKLTQQSLAALAEGGEHSYEGWRDVPVWYLGTVEDQALPIEAQRWMAEKVRQEEEKQDVVMREVRSGHSPMLSCVQETAEFTLDAVSAFGG